MNNQCPRCNRIMDSHPTDKIATLWCSKCNGLYTEQFIGMLTPELIRQIKNDHAGIQSHYQKAPVSTSKPETPKPLDPKRGLNKWLNA